MKSENILDAINDIDYELVEDAEKKHTSHQKVIIRWTAIAACFVVIFGIVWKILAPPKIPIYENAMYTAEEIANMFEQEIAGPTSSYEKVYFPSRNTLSLNPIPDSEYITTYEAPHIYEYDNPFKEAEFATFLDSRMPAIARVLGIRELEYTIRQLGDYYLETDNNTDGNEYYTVSGNQYSLYHEINIDGQWFNNKTGEILLDGQRLEIDLSQSNEEILESIEWAKEKLFTIFGVFFTDAKITRSYDESGENGATFLNVYFYNKADNPLNVVANAVYSDHIQLTFNNYLNNEADVVSSTVIWDVSIEYRQYRVDPKEVYSPIAQVQKISLAEAEKLLAKGYVFGGQSCPLCMTEQGKVDFSNYDYVELRYVSGKLGENNRQRIPFYAFYKEIGTAPNGNVIYARTYVPAIEVSGYEEYFKSQEAKHNAQ